MPHIWTPQRIVLPNRAVPHHSWFRASGRPPFDVGAVNNSPDPFSNSESIAFDGVDEYINLGRLTDLDGATAATWTFWLYSDPISVNDWAMGQWATSDRVWAVFTRGTGGFRFYISPNGTTLAYVETPAATLTAGVWTHFVVTYSAGTVAVYRNGVSLSLTTSGTIPSALYTSSAGNTFLGAVDNGPSALYAGSLDEVAWWVGTAASSGQAVEIYNGGDPADMMALPTMPQPDHFYRPDGYGFPTLHDYGTAGDDGTPANMEAADFDTGNYAP